MKVYLAALQLLDDREEQALALLPPARRDYASRYGGAEDRRRSILAGLLLRSGLGVTEDSQLSYGPQGQPLLPHICFSLSHSGNWTGLVWDSEPIGLDVEAWRPVRDNLLRKVFTQQEQRWINQAGGEDQRRRRFFILWTRKESVMKATGQGFRLDPAGFDLCPVDEGPHVVEGREWFFHSLQLDGHTISLVSPKPQRIQPVYVTWEQLSGEPGALAALTGEEWDDE